MGFATEQLTGKALQALEEVLVRCGTQAVPKCLMLRFTLAYLYSVSRGEPDLFIKFWRTVTEPPRPGESEAISATGRRQNANAILNAIYLRLGLKRP
jgi:hypothetical protein